MAGLSHRARSQRRAAGGAGEVRKLPRAALEVLVVIAFHQPITRPEIEAVRGALLSQATMELLLETGLIRAHGRREAPGTPVLSVTTPLFLERFSLGSLRDLPGSGVIAAASPLPRPGGPRSPAGERAADDAQALLLATATGLSRDPARALA